MPPFCLPLASRLAGGLRTLHFLIASGVGTRYGLLSIHQPLRRLRMNKRRTQTEESSVAPEPQEANAATGKLKQAQEELARMEETQRLCFRTQNDLTKLAEELRQRKYSEFDINYLLEPKGPRKIPGYQLSDMQRQKKFIDHLKAPKPASSHAEAVENEPPAQGHARG
jgi:hypothetical protein